MIVGLSVTPANRADHDEAVAVLDGAMRHLSHPPEVVCADAAYGSGENRAACEERGIHLVSLPPKVPTREYFTVEDFQYAELLDQFICPADAVLS